MLEDTSMWLAAWYGTLAEGIKGTKDGDQVWQGTGVLFWTESYPFKNHTVLL